MTWLSLDIQMKNNTIMIILKITMEMNINSFRNQNEKNDTIMITNDNHQNCKMKNKNHYETVVQVQKVEILSHSEVAGNGTECEVKTIELS